MEIFSAHESCFLHEDSKALSKIEIVELTTTLEYLREHKKTKKIVRVSNFGPMLGLILCQNPHKKPHATVPLIHLTKGGHINTSNRSINKSIIDTYI